MPTLYIVCAKRSAWLACALAFGMATVAFADFEDAADWTQVQDPPNADFSASADTVNNDFTLSAAGGVGPDVSPGTDIGYQSVDGNTVGTSTQGYYFNASQAFSVSVNYSLSNFANSVGAFGIGFGIGLDGTGENSVGAALGMYAGQVTDGTNTAPIQGGVFSGVGRVNDEDLNPVDPTTLGNNPSSGTLTISFDPNSETITLQATDSANPGNSLNAVYDSSNTTNGSSENLFDVWDGESVLVSFFLRSEAVDQATATTLAILAGEPFGTYTFSPQGWNGTTNGDDFDAVFSDLQVLGGTPQAVPEPATLLLLAAGAFSLLSRSRRR